MNAPATIGPHLERLQKLALGVGVLGAAASLFAALADFDSFARSYLLAYAYWIGVPLSCLGLLMLHHLVGGRWSFFIRRQLEAGSRTLPLFVLFFIPMLAILYGSDLWIWTDPEVVHSEHALEHKAGYLNTTFFVVRAALAFALWIGMATLLNNWSARQEETGDGSLVGRMSKLSGPGIVLYFLSVTVVAIDWLMSLDPKWFSTIYGLIYIIGQALLTLSFIVLVTRRLKDSDSLMGRLANSERFHELGNLMLAFVLLWAYMSVSQLLIIWSANLPEENPWYTTRFQDPWAAIGLILLLFHFTLPFLLLLWRVTKRHPNLLRNVALGLIAMRFVELFWIIKPSVDPGAQASFAAANLAMDVFAWLGVGGLWTWFFIRELKKRRLVPVNDPRLPREFSEKLAEEGAGA